MLRTMLRRARLFSPRVFQTSRWLLLMAEWLCDSPRHAWERADAWPRALRRTRLPLKLWVTVGRFSSQANTAPNTPVVVHGPRGPDAWWAAEQRLRHGVDESSDRGRGGRRNLDRGSRRSIVGGDRRGHAFVRNSRGHHIVRRDVSGRSRRGGPAGCTVVCKQARYASRDAR
jgi:plasmid stabilization system protein ParE